MKNESQQALLLLQQYLYQQTDEQHPVSVTDILACWQQHGTVELLCDNEIMRSVIDRFGENVRAETVDEQHFRATVEVAPSPPFFGWVFTFCGKIRIVSPAAVLEEMRDMAAWLK